LQQSNGKHNSEDAIISAGIRNSIEVRSEEQAWSVRLQRRIYCTEISSSIDSHLSTEWFHPSGNLFVALPHGWAQKYSPRAAEVFRKRREPQASIDDFSGASCDLGCLHWILLWFAETSL
jgi:hypothetical protein